MASHQYATKPPNISTMPPGVPYIIGNEAAERFSFYGMRSILFVFMTKYLLDQTGAKNVMGSDEAAGYAHYFVVAVYFLPIAGALIADGWLGKYRTILSLSIVYCLGHLTLAFMDSAFGIGIGQRWVLFAGLLLIAIGSGGIKPCVSANVGDQFGESNKHLLPKIFGWFYFSINAGSSISSLLCPFLLSAAGLGPRWAFGIPGVAMVIATIVFWIGRGKMVHVPPRGLGYLRDTFSGEGLATLGRLAGVYVFVIIFWALWDQSAGIEWTHQAESLNLHVSWLPWVSVHWSPFQLSAGWGLDLLPAQVQTANPILILLFIPLVNYVIYPLMGRFFAPTPLRRIGIGLFLTAFSFVLIAFIQKQIDGGIKPTVNFQLLAYVILTLGEAMVSITGLEFSYTQAPNSMKSSIMALWLLAVAAGNFLAAQANFVKDAHKYSDFAYFRFWAVVMFGAACLFVVVAMFYRGKTYLQSQEKPLEELVPEAATEVGMP
jgi:POT family proton-dependent oligopeptide transporter